MAVDILIARHRDDELINQEISCVRKNITVCKNEMQTEMAFSSRARSQVLGDFTQQILHAYTQWAVTAPHTMG